MLVQSGVVSPEDVEEALRYSRETNVKLGQAIVALGLASEADICTALGRQFGMPVYTDLSRVNIDGAAARLLPESAARQRRALALSRTRNGNTGNDVITVAVADPLDYYALDDITDRLDPCEVDFVIAPESEILKYMPLLYKNTESIARYADQLKSEISRSAFETDVGGTLNVDDSSDAAVVNLLKSVFEDAIASKASDVHIEPDAGALRIRQRIDGRLTEQILPGSEIGAAIALRIKLMAGLDISEKRLPQDGRFYLKASGSSVDIDVRVSTLPTQYGESIVMRILNQAEGLLALEATGMPPDILERFRAQIRRPHGMILVTGPTGSGKTTTLYGALSEINTPEVKIITVEDPVEYHLPRVTQVQVNPKIGLGFANVLRSILRQDPDVILVGEMRDGETSEIGLRAAMTGHLVLSTLHTNDAVSSAMRLVNMGAPGYLVAGSLRAVLAQRLVRLVCPRCGGFCDPDPDEERFIEAALGVPAAEQRAHRFKRGNGGKGCQYCNFTGYKGRTGVYELLVVGEDMMDALRREDLELFARRARESPGYRPFAARAYELAVRGVTTLSEVIRLCEVTG